MKNVMKKLFSLLLVGVVAVSMFGFIAPNNVDAAEAEPSKGTVYFHQKGSGYIGNYIASFYDASEKLICSYNTGRMYVGQSRSYAIPKETKTLTVQTKTRLPFHWENAKTFIFGLNEGKESLGGSVSVTGKGALISTVDFIPSSTGCWEYVGTKAR